MHIGLSIKFAICLPHFKGTIISRQTLEKYSDIKFHDYLLLCTPIVPRGKTDTSK